MSSFLDTPIHLIGIGGSGMSGLAEMLHRKGARVSGSDRCASPLLARLAAEGITVSTIQTADSFPERAELVVVSAAIPEDHPELQQARRRNLRVVRYAEMLGMLQADGGGIAIAGTHGKSTTTAWLTYALRLAGLDPSFIVGAEVEQLGGSSGAGDGPHFVVEACEYQRSFLHLCPQSAAILNIEEDHLDYYAGLDAICQAFAEFAGRIPRDGLLVTSGEDPNCRALARGAACRSELVGLSPLFDWSAADLALVNGCYTYTLLLEGKPQMPVKLGLPGIHNVRNSLAVIALARHAGAGWPPIQQALTDFRGARRRLETRAVCDGVRIVDDYAHHPTEIRATLRAAREQFDPRRLYVVFQPHQHSRTRFLLDDFAASFADADEVVVPDIYFVRDSQRERDLIGSGDLVNRIGRRGGNARHVTDFDTIVRGLLPKLQPGDVVISMGAGDIWKVADELVQRLRSDLTA